MGYDDLGDGKETKKTKAFISFFVCDEYPSTTVSLSTKTDTIRLSLYVYKEREKDLVLK